MGYLTTGNEIVDAVSKINFQGDITPRIWRKTITKSNGKPYPLARDILSDLVYWYRAYEIVDEQTQEISFRKKFRDDLLYKSYEQMSEEFGESKRVIRDVLKRLEEIGVIKRHFRTVTYENGMTLNNVMYIELIPDVLFRLTYPDRDMEAKMKCDKTEEKVREVTEFREPSPPSDENVTRGMRDSDTKTEKEKNESDKTEEKVREVTEFREPSPPGDENVTRVVTKMSPQNTENTTEINNNYNNQNPYPSIRERAKGKVCSHEDGMDGTAARAAEFVRQTAKLNLRLQGENAMPQLEIWQKKEQLKEEFLAALPKNLGERYPLAFLQTWYDYSDLVDLATLKGIGVQDIQDILSLLYDTLNTTKASLRIGGEEKPAPVVIAKLLKLSSFDILYALEKFHSQTTRIHNQRAYLLTILYLAKEQNRMDVSNQVMHDMYGTKGETEK